MRHPPHLLRKKHPGISAITAVKDDLIRNNNTSINWIPESHRQRALSATGLKTLQDWGYLPRTVTGVLLFPIWECECGHRHCIGSRQELYELSGNEKAKTVEFHRPYIDEITIKCPKCGKDMHRVPEVLDCWFDSGAMPFAQYHYPFENKELFERQFPAQFISEAVDQTRGWFHSLLAESTLLFNKAPYQNVIVLGHVQDETRSEDVQTSKGNAVDPFDCAQKARRRRYPLVFLFKQFAAVASFNRFHDDAVIRRSEKVYGHSLEHICVLMCFMRNIDNFDPTKYTLDYDKLSNVMDKWLLSKLSIHL